MSVRIDGIDISHWQDGALHFATAKEAGVRFVYHKATEGTAYTDPRYAPRRVEVAKAQLPFGAYHFARPSQSDGKTQARRFLAVARPQPGDMRPMLDLEDRAGLNGTQLTAWVRDFVLEVVAETGVPPFIYTPFDLGNTFNCPLWVARYSNAMTAPRIPKPWTSYTIWQFSNGVYGHPNTVAGIGACDLNTMNGDPAALVRAFRLGAPIVEERTPVPAKVPPRRSPNADAIDAAAAKGVKATKGKRRRVFQQIRDLIKPYRSPGK